MGDRVVRSLSARGMAVIVVLALAMHNHLALVAAFVCSACGSAYTVADLRMKRAQRGTQRKRGVAP